MNLNSKRIFTKAKQVLKRYIPASVLQARKTRVLGGKARTVDGLTYRVHAAHAQVTGVKKPAAHITIPEEVDGKLVTAIAARAFAGQKKLQTVAIPTSVTVMGAGAFAQCTSLTEVELPLDLEIVDTGAFEGCESLQIVRLPFMLRVIRRRAFASCTSLKELPHFVVTGTGAERRARRGIIIDTLPVTLTEIGEAAFVDCESLERIAIPHQVKAVQADTFAGCASLAEVWLHSKLEAIHERAFAGCSQLQHITVPKETRAIGRDAFATATTMVCVSESAAAEYAQQRSQPVRLIEPHTPLQQIETAFEASGDLSVRDVLESPELMQTYLDRYEVRPPAQEMHREGDPFAGPAPQPARYTRQDGVYRPVNRDDSREESEGTEVSIVMAGDLMCGHRQQRSALVDGSYNFSRSFRRVAPILKESDLAIANLEVMSSPTYPYTGNSTYVDDRPHLNAPYAYLRAVRWAGFDVAMNAQNHMYDTGVKGIFESLDALNRAQLLHGGMYASAEEPRYLLIEVKGIRLGLVAYLDPARQKMKQANFTDEGVDATSSHFDEDRIRRDISAARAAGAEFVLAYCHWGREYTHRVTMAQKRYAAMVANAGADYIFGSHSHCLQPYARITTTDGRVVPVVYSGGNFLSDMRRDQPITRDSIIASLTLDRNESGEVVITGEGYIPCRIVVRRSMRGYVTVVPCKDLLAGALNYPAEQAEEDLRRITSVMGKEYPTL